MRNLGISWPFRGQFRGRAYASDYEPVPATDIEAMRQQEAINLAIETHQFYPLNILVVPEKL